MSSYREHSNEWRCLICESWNESWRKVCRVCGTDKPKQGSEPPGKDVWQCPFCDTWNENSEKFCWFCGLIPEESKPEPTIKEGWKCPHCGEWNESNGSSEKVCRYCKRIPPRGSNLTIETGDNHPSFLWVVIAVAILVISLLTIPGILQDLEEWKDEKARSVNKETAAIVTPYAAPTRTPLYTPPQTQTPATSSTAREPIIMLPTPSGTADGNILDSGAADRIMDKNGYLLGEWGEDVSTRTSVDTTQPGFYLSNPVGKCTELKIELEIGEYTGNPFGSWYLGTRDLDGKWSHPAEFYVDKSTVNQTETFTVRFDKAISFDAITVVPATKYNSYSMTFNVLRFKDAKTQ